MTPHYDPTGLGPVYELWGDAVRRVRIWFYRARLAELALTNPGHPRIPHLLRRINSLRSL